MVYLSYRLMHTAKRALLPYTAAQCTPFCFLLVQGWALSVFFNFFNAKKLFYCIFIKLKTYYCTSPI